MNVPDEVMAELEAGLMPYSEWLLRRKQVGHCCVSFLMQERAHDESCRHAVFDEFAVHLCGEEVLSPAAIVPADETRASRRVGSCPTCARNWTTGIADSIDSAHARRAAIIDNIRIALGDIDEATEQAERARLMPV